VVRDERDRKRHSTVGTVDVEDHLLEAALLGDDSLDLLDRDVALGEPRGRVGDVCGERAPALDDPMSASSSPVIRPSK
jgi:hypothetical protein